LRKTDDVDIAVTLNAFVEKRIHGSKSILTTRRGIPVRKRASMVWSASSFWSLEDHLFRKPHGMTKFGPGLTDIVSTRRTIYLEVRPGLDGKE
jgi:hypothetical protein